MEGLLGEFDQALPQRGYIALLGGYMESRASVGQVALVPHAQHGSLGRPRVGEHGAGGIHHLKDDPGALGSTSAALDTELLESVVGLMDAGGVGEAEQHAVQQEGVLDGVARGTAYVAHDGAFLAQQGVE